jgi:hypothetical protein
MKQSIYINTLLHFVLVNTKKHTDVKDKQLLFNMCIDTK